jgi:hypothetical protein
VCVRERERERERESVFVCVCVRERERERICAWDSARFSSVMVPGESLASESRAWRVYQRSK